MTTPQPEQENKPARPSDYDLEFFIGRMWRNGGNLEFHSISLCLASNMRVEADAAWDKDLKKQLDRLVKEGKIRKQRFLPGRHYYTVA